MSELKALAELAADQVAATWLDTRAEQALLGALLWEPTQLQNVKSWLRSADFFSAHHQLIYKTIDELVTAKAALTFGMHHQLTYRTIDKLVRATPTPTFEELTQAVYERVAPYGIDATYLHTLMRVCPQPSNAVVYGHITIQADARRAVARYNHRLAETIAVAQDGRASIPEVIEAATQIAHVVGQLKARTQSEHEQPGAQQPMPPPRAPSPERIDQDSRLLTCLINRPNDIPEIAPLLNSSDFASPLAGQIYDLILSMHQSGTPIDSITVMWNAQRAQLLDARDMSENLFDHFDEVLPDTAIILARDIQHAATIEHAISVAGILTSALAGHSMSTTQILQLATSQVDRLQERHRRHGAAYHPRDDHASPPAHGHASTPHL